MYIVTGANGFIGSVLVRHLNLLEHKDLIAVDQISPKERPAPLSKAAYQDYVSSEDLLTALENGRWQELKGIFHMGACSSTTEMDVEYLQQNNTEYSIQLFKHCAQRQIPYIYASSGAVYGDGQMGFDDALAPEELKPLNPYGWSKLNFDRWVLEQSPSESPPLWAGLRFFNVYGPNEYHKGEMASLVYKAFSQIQQTGKLKLFRSHRPDYADGMQMRDFVYVKDICRWMTEILSYQTFSNGIYNMGFGKAQTWLDLAHAVFSALHKEVEIEWMDIPESIRHQYQYFTEAKIDRLMGQGLSDPQWPIQEGVKDYIHNHLMKDNPYL